jgi:hypothetical protein
MSYPALCNMLHEINDPGDSLLVSSYFVTKIIVQSEVFCEQREGVTPQFLTVTSKLPHSHNEGAACLQTLQLLGGESISFSWVCSWHKLISEGFFILLTGLELSNPFNSAETAIWGTHVVSCWNTWGLTHMPGLVTLTLPSLESTYPSPFTLAANFLVLCL